MTAAPLWPRLRGSMRSGWRLVREIAGEREYEKYVAHQSAHHAGQALMTERQFWREYVDRKEKDPGARCC